MSDCALLSFLGYMAHTSLQNARVLLLSIILIFSLINSIFSKMFKSTFQWELLNLLWVWKSLSCLSTSKAIWLKQGFSSYQGLFLPKSTFVSSWTLFPHSQWAVNISTLYAMFFSLCLLKGCKCSCCHLICAQNWTNDSIVLWLLTILFNLTRWYPPENGLDKTAKALPCLENEPQTFSLVYNPLHCDAV